MKAQSVDDGDWTLTISEAPIIGPDLRVQRWDICYWEVRHSAVGQQICQAIRMNTIAPWIVSTPGGELGDVANTREFLIQSDVPAILMERMEQKGLLR